MAEHVLVLLNFWPSLFGARVRIALAEKGVDCEVRDEDLSNKSQLLLDMNPVHTKIPVLIHNGKPICESLNIVEYIDEVWSHKAPLLPSDPLERAHARFWANYADQKILTNMRLVRGETGEAQEAAKKELIQSFKVLEAELGDKTYFGGEIFGFLDVALISFYSLFYAVEMSANFSIEEECPKLVEWAKRCSLRDSVSQYLPDKHKVFEFLVELKKRRQAQQNP